MVSGVIFDLWNTLVYSGGPRLVTRIANLVNEPRDGVQVDDSEVTEYLRSSGCLHIETPVITVLEDLWRRHRRSELPEEVRVRFHEEVEEFVQEATFLDGALEAIDAIRTADISMAIVSNASSVSVQVLDRLTLHERITPDIWLSCQSGYLKPDPRAFATVAKYWRTDPAKVVVVGDKIGTDMLGSRLCGMRSVLIENQIERSTLETRSSIDAVARGVRDLPTLLRKLGWS